MPHTHTVPESAHGQRLSRYLQSLLPHIPYVGLQKLIRTGALRLDGKRTKPDTRVETGQTLTWPEGQGPAHTASRASRAYTATKADLAELEAMKLHEDKHLLILNKPAGLASQAGSGISKSLDRLLTAAYPEGKAPKLAHRLDRDTTGLILAGKNRTTVAALGQQLQARDLHKTYLLLVCNPDAHLHTGQTGHFRWPLKKVGPLAVVAEDGDTAHTSWKVLQTFAHGTQSYALVEASPHTGRMNQIRAHFAHHGTPIVGDAKYGHTQSLPAWEALNLGKTPRLFLHAWKLAFTHPTTLQPFKAFAPAPNHFQSLANVAPSVAHYLQAE